MNPSPTLRAATAIMSTAFFFEQIGRDREVLEQLFNNALLQDRVHEAAQAELEESLSFQDGKAVAKGSNAALLELGSRMDAAQFAGNAFGGALSMVLNNMLQRFAKTNYAEVGEHLRCGPPINGVPLTIAVWAASNAFRHQDEWKRIKQPVTPEIRRRHREKFASIDPLNQIAPPGTVPMLHGWVSTTISIVKVLRAIGDDDYNVLHARIVAAAEAIISRDDPGRAAWAEGLAMAKRRGFVAGC